MLILKNIKKTYIKYIKFIVLLSIFQIYSITNYTLGKKNHLYHRDKEFTYIDAMYYTLVTITSIGYGDITPRSQTSKFICIIQILLFWTAINYLFS